MVDRNYRNEVDTIELILSGKDFRKALLNLKLSLELLKHEPDGTFEKDVYHGAKQSVGSLEQLVKQVG